MCGASRRTRGGSVEADLSAAGLLRVVSVMVSVMVSVLFVRGRREWRVRVDVDGRRTRFTLTAASVAALRVLRDLSPAVLGVEAVRGILMQLLLEQARRTLE